MSSDDTTTRILDTAERLFAERGIAATSMRKLTTEAGVNLAAVHYHFGSKAKLIEAVFTRRLELLAADRNSLLEAAEAQGKPTTEDVLTAFVAPALHLARDPARGGAVFMRLLGRTYTEPDAHVAGVLTRHSAEPLRRFREALHGSVPELPSVEFLWRFHFVIGALSHAMADTYWLREISDGRCDPADLDGAVQRLVDFLAAGLRAPCPTRVTRRR